MSDAPLALHSKLYFRSGGTYDTPGENWLEIDQVETLTVTPKWDQADANSRALRMKFTAKTRLGLEITGSIKKVAGDPGYEMLRAAMLSDDVLDVLCLDGPRDEDGSSGWRADMQAYDMTEDQSPDKVLYNDFQLMPYASHPIMAASVETTGGLTFTQPGS